MISTKTARDNPRPEVGSGVLTAPGHEVILPGDAKSRLTPAGWGQPRPTIPAFGNRFWLKIDTTHHHPPSKTLKKCGKPYPGNPGRPFPEGNACPGNTGWLFPRGNTRPGFPGWLPRRREGRSEKSEAPSPHGGAGYENPERLGPRRAGRWEKPGRSRAVPRKSFPALRKCDGMEPLKTKPQRNPSCMRPHTHRRRPRC